MSDSRLEKFIYAICSMEVDNLPTPLSRIEILWNCLITGEMPDFEPESRNEIYLMVMLDLYDIENLPTPLSRSEKLLYKIAVGDTDLSDIPAYLSRYEELLGYLAENGTIGFEYVLYTLNQSLSTLYSTKERPVKSAILKGNTLINLASPHEEREVQFIYRWQAYNVINDKIVGGLVDGELIYMSIEINIHEINIETPEFRILTSRGTGGFAIGVKSFDELKAMPKNEWIKVSAIRTVDIKQSLDQYCLQCGIMGEHPTENGEQVARVSFRKPMWINLTKMFGKGKEPTLFECDNIPYFEGMQSVKMPILKTVGKNLFDISYYENFDNLKNKTDTYVSYKELLKLEPNTEYRFLSDNRVIPPEYGQYQI